MSEYQLKQFDSFQDRSSFQDYVMGVDLGGTNTNIAIAGIKEQIPHLLYSLHFKTKHLPSIIPALNIALSYSQNQFDIHIQTCCIGAAGVVSHAHDKVQLTNISWDIDAVSIKEETHLGTVYMLNDFQIIGYGINLLDPDDPNDLICIKNTRLEPDPRATKAVIGGGTGLGKSILVFNESQNAYIPLSTEGGHVDCPLYTQDELDLARYITHHRLQSSAPLSYEDVLSGQGLESIYSYIQHAHHYPETQYTKEIDAALEKAPLISKYRTVDETCHEVFQWYLLFYARCAKNFVFDTLATGGIYLAGGIAAKNKEIFQSTEFIQTFENTFRRPDVLKQTPIYVIVNYDVSLYGACLAATYQMKKDKI